MGATRAARERRHAEEEQVLEPLGFGRVEAQVYELLAAHGRLTISQVHAQAGDLDGARLQKALDTLVAHGLVRRLAAPDQEFVVAPPDYAIEVLIAERMSALQTVRERSLELAARVRTLTQDSDPTELIEIVSGEGSVRHLFLQVIKSARREIAVFDRPPYAAQVDETMEKQAERLAADGLRLRTVFDRSLLEEPLHVQRILQGVERGEQARVARVPLKLAIIDGEWGMLPLLHAQGGTPEAVVIVRSSVLLDSMVALFESVWQHAVEIRPTGEEQLLAESSEGELRQLAHLLGAGLTDTAVARHLDISERTLRRRLKDLMEELGVDSRFAAGARAAERGWL